MKNDNNNNNNFSNELDNIIVYPESFIPEIDIVSGSTAKYSISFKKKDPEYSSTEGDYPSEGNKTNPTLSDNYKKICNDDILKNPSNPNYLDAVCNAAKVYGLDSSELGSRATQICEYFGISSASFSSVLEDSNFSGNYGEALAEYQSDIEDTLSQIGNNLDKYVDGEKLMDLLIVQSLYIEALNAKIEAQIAVVNNLVDAKPVWKKVGEKVTTGWNGKEVTEPVYDWVPESFDTWAAKYAAAKEILDNLVRERTDAIDSANKIYQKLVEIGLSINDIRLSLNFLGSLNIQSDALNIMDELLRDNAEVLTREQIEKYLNEYPFDCDEKTKAKLMDYVLSLTDLGVNEHLFNSNYKTVTGANYKERNELLTYILNRGLEDYIKKVSPSNLVDTTSAIINFAINQPIIHVNYGGGLNMAAPPSDDVFKKGFGMLLKQSGTVDCIGFVKWATYNAATYYNQNPNQNYSEIDYNLRKQFESNLGFSKYMGSKGYNNLSYEPSYTESFFDANSSVNKNVDSETIFNELISRNQPIVMANGYGSTGHVFFCVPYVDNDGTRMIKTFESTSEALKGVGTQNLKFDGWFNNRRNRGSNFSFLTIDSICSAALDEMYSPKS